MVLCDMDIVAASVSDLRELREISRRTFDQTFGAVNTPANMEFYLNHHFSEPKLRSELENPDSSFYFLTNAEKVVGYVKLNRGLAQTVLPNENGIEIERIYVDETYKGKGFGHMLMSKAVHEASLHFANYLWLGVWEKNHPAIRFYERNGFVKYDTHSFFLGDDEQTDLLMKRVLR